MLEIPPFVDPAHLPHWQESRAEIRSTLWDLLGENPEESQPANVSVDSRTREEGYWLERVSFHLAEGETVGGYLFLPDLPGPNPGILYCHWHGGQYEIGKDEMLRTNATPVAPGPALARLG